MDFKQAFNSNSGYSTSNTNPFVLDIYFKGQGGSVYMSADFLTRTLVTRNSYGDAGVVVTPFAQLDRDVVVAMRDRLVELGGTPPDLAPEAPANPAPQRKFNP